MKTTLLFVMLICASFTSSFAQQHIVAAGSDLISSAGSVSQSIGIVSYTSLKNTNFTIDQGIQHPFEIVHTGINSLSASVESFIAYPNPFKDLIKFQLNKETEYRYKFYDLTGVLQISGILTNGITSINTENFKPGIYLLIITDASQNFQTIKLIKY
jgi:hypothetical protein